MIDLSYIIPVMKARNMTDRTIKRTNQYSGESAMLNKAEVLWHDAVKMAEINEEYEVMQHALDKFSRLNPKAYMVLLD